MSSHRVRIARAIRAFVDNPITNLVKGILLVLIGLSEASRTLMDDIAQKKIRVGHGLIIIGLFNILDCLPHLIEGLEASNRYLELRDRKERTEPGSSSDPGRSEGPVD
jgi:hypothetical protein